MQANDDVLTSGLLNVVAKMPGVRRDDADKAALVAVLTALSGMGAVMTYSTMTYSPAAMTGAESLLALAFVRQVCYVVVGACLAVIFAKTDYRRLIRYHRPILIVSIALLAVVLIPGIGAKVNGARRWFRIGQMSCQPSEMAKFAIVIFLAGYLTQKRDRMRDFKGTVLPAIGVIAVTSALIVVEPDLGTTALIATVSWIMLCMGGARLLYVIGLPLLGSPVALAVLRHYPHAWGRILIWLNPWRDAKGAGYHIIQSLIAVGSGGATGMGLGASSQKLQFLPEPSSDFIFAILAEELGFVGVTVVIVLYVAFVLVGMTIARRASDLPGRLLATGITSIVAIQAIINIGVVTQLLPTKGIALPFISAGGSAAVFMIAGAGILYSVAAHRDGLAPEYMGVSK